jgi:hypothetical protein
LLVPFGQFPIKKDCKKLDRSWADGGENIHSLATGSGFVGLSQGLKLLANGKGCTILWTFVAAIATGVLSSIRTLGKLAILTWVGFASIFTAVFIVV